MACIHPFRTTVAELSRRAILRGDSVRSLPAVILERNTADLPPRRLANEPADLERGLGVIQSLVMNVGDAVPLGVGATDLRRKCQIGPEAVRCGQARALADQHDHHSRVQQRTDLVAESDPRPRRNHDFDRARAGFDAAGTKQRYELPHQFDRMGMDRPWRQTVADDDRQRTPASRTAVLQKTYRAWIKPAPEIGASQIVAPVAGPARDADRIETKRSK